jgi:3-oxoacyl-[acyl-carrier-protein] synthase III
MSNATRGSWLHSICYEIGPLVPVEELVRDGIKTEVVSQLQSRGIRSFSKIDEGLAPHMGRCIATSLARSKLLPSEIDMVLLLTESYDELFDDTAESQSFRTVRERLFDFAYDIGIRKATVMSLSYGGCANALHGVTVAHALLRQGIARNVMLIAAERYPAAHTRLRPEAASIAADGVAVCLLSTTRQNQTFCFDVEQICVVPYDAHRRSEEDGNMLLESFRAMKSAAADCYEVQGLSPADYDWVVLGDYNMNTSLIYARLLGFPPERACLANVGVRGHIPFDPLINLADLVDSGACATDSRVLLYTGGPVSGGVVSLRAEGMAGPIQTRAPQARDQELLGAEK